MTRPAPAMSKLALLDPTIQRRAMNMHNKLVEREASDYFTAPVTPTPNVELRAVFSAALHRGIALGLAAQEENK